MGHGLKQNLITEIKHRGFMTYEGVREYCRIWGRRPENGYRRLRPSEQNEIETVYKTFESGKPKYIIGYKPKGKEYQQKLFKE